MKLEDLLPGVRVEVLAPKGACSTCGGHGKILAKTPTLEAIGDALSGVVRSIRLVRDRACPHCWGVGREAGQ